MMLKRAICISLAAISAGAWADTKPQLQPRKAIPKINGVFRPAMDAGRLQVKFVDSIKARAQTNGRVRGGAGNVEIAEVSKLCRDYGVQFVRAINHSDQVLATLETRAADHSKKAQPDLGGIMYVTGPREALDKVADILYGMDTIEFVGWDPEFTIAGGMESFATPPPGAGDCFTTPATPPLPPFCGNENCCNAMTAISPICTTPADEGGEWDVFCTNLANLFCSIDDGADRCLTPLVNGGCNEVHPTGGCNSTTCCNTVCDVDEFCCIAEWDIGCVNAASNLCPGVPGDATPDLTAFQGFLDAVPYPDPQLTVMGLGPPAPAGFGGEGFDLNGQPDNIDPFDGLVGLAEELLQVYGVGDTNFTRGLGTRVGVVEFGAFVQDNPVTAVNEDHEDLVVITEPGQTVITIPELTEPGHGTACLGIIGAENNGLGVTGIVPECELWFFPTTSVEEGGRLLSAMTSAANTFSQGDVLSFSIGPGGGCGTLASSPAESTIIRVASDLGILCCIAAGNSCCNLTADDQGTGLGPDSGAVIVGAITPGRPFCRLGFSNHAEVNEDEITTSAWGTLVTTTGGNGELFNGGSPGRSYTMTFNGTSAACPQVAAGLAALQGLARQFFGISLNAEQMIAVIASIPQCEIPVPDNLPGQPDESTCGGDFDPDEDPNWVVGYLDLVESAATMIASLPQFDDSPLIEEFEVTRGTLLSGNIFSLKASDNNYLIIQAAVNSPGSTAPGFSGSGPTTGFTPAPPNSIRGLGAATDLQVLGHVINPNVQSIGLTTEVSSTTGHLGIMFVEMFNYDINRFQFVDLRFVSSAPCTDENCGGLNEGTCDGPEIDCSDTHQVGFAPAFIQDDTGEFIVRLWTVVPGNINLTTHVIRHDFLGVNTGPVIGNP